MTVRLQKAGKHYNKRWIFKNLDLSISTNDSMAVLGENGSGKSTLLKVFSGQLSLDSGSIQFKDESIDVDPNLVFQSVSISAPYIELIEEMTLKEFLDFHFSFKASRMPTLEMIKTIGLEEHTEKRLDTFSSGMKQRVNLAQALFSNSALILLDEPYSNLDEKGKLLFDNLIPKLSKERVLVVASNNEREYSMCAKRINVQDYEKE